MAAVDFTKADLVPFAVIDDARADAMIADALALATRIAPCIILSDFAHPGAAKAIIRGAVLRWNEAGNGGRQQETTGPFNETPAPRRGMFWPSEIEQLQDLCTTDELSGAYAVDTACGLPYGVVHADICAINFGAQYCSCGAILTAGLPLYENIG